MVAGLVVPELDHRYRTAAALLADLARVSAGELPRGPGGEASDPEPLAFVARGAELAHLVSAFDEVRRGWGAVLLVRGERGAGKSRLLRELTRAVAGEPRGARVLFVRCELDDPAPLAALRATLASLAGSVAFEEAAELRAALGPELAPFAAALSSELAARLGVSPAAPRVGADAFSELAAELIARAAARLGPVLLCVDDAQWIDPISAEVLARLSQRMRGLPILVAAATRADAGAAVFGAGEQLRAIALSPFDEQAALALAAAYLGAPPPPGLVAWMVRVADGTPLGLADVLDAMLDAGVLLPHDGEWRFDREVAERMQLPRGTLALLERRIGELPEATRRVFEAAAVIGRSFEHDLLAAVVGVDREDLGFAIAEARRNGLVEAAEGGVHRFVHDCVREALLSGLDGDARRAVHQRVAEALDAAGVSDAYALATHYAAGLPERDLARVLEVCHAATARALEAFDHEAAIRFVEMARASAERAGGELGPRLLMDAGEAELRLGAHAEAIARFEAALAGTRDPSPARRSSAAWPGRSRCGPTRRRRGGRSSAPSGSSARRCRSSGPPAWGGRPSAGSRSRLRAAPALGAGAARERIELLCELHYQNARLGLENGRPLRLLQSTLRARALSLQLGSGPSATSARVEAQQGVVACVLGRTESAFEHLARARAAAAEVGNPPARAYCTQLTALAACFAGDFDAALEHMRELLGEQRHWLETSELCWNVFNAHWIEAVRGRPREAWAWLEHALERVARQGGAPAGFEPIALSARATYAALHADYAEAAFRRALRAPFDPSAPLTGFVRTGSWGARARWLVERGEVGAELDALVAEHRAEGVEARKAHPLLAEYYVAVAQGRIHACLRAEAHERGRAAEKLAEALADLRAVARSDLLRSHLRLAEAVHAWLRGKGQKARARLREAEELACDQSCAWVRYGVERVRAHMLRGEGRIAASNERARAALFVAREQGAVRWGRWIEEELGVRLRAPAPAVALTSASRSGSMSTSRGQLRALLHVLRAGSRQLPQDEQAQALVDEVLEAVDAERGVVLFEADRRGREVVTAGRERGGAEWMSASPRARAPRPRAEERRGVGAGARGRARPARRGGPPLAPRPAGRRALRRARSRSTAAPRGRARAPRRALLPGPGRAGARPRAARSRAARGGAAARAEDGGRGEARRRPHARLQQHADDHEDLDRDARGLAEPRREPPRRARAPQRRWSKRAAGLTQQLLTFARRQARLREPHDLNAVLGEIGPMLRRLLPERIALTVELADEPVRVMIDRGLLEQSIVNLAVNARDAIANRGSLSIRLSRADLDEEDVRFRPRLLAGPHGCIVVADDGPGMTREVRESAFEPFFTTKGRGSGTGLGLAMVHGFVDQSDGAIELESEPGRGTTFRIFLPITEGAPVTASDGGEAPPADRPRPPEPAEAAPRGETILVVDDEALVRRNIERALSDRGYTVLGAGEPEEALALARSAQIDLLISDVIMPRMSGLELAQAVRQASPATKLLFISGYTDGQLPELVKRDRVPLLVKPFGSEEIGEAVRDLLGR
ncbi:MAG: AAA family ATPase [Sandaracinaceae bacterium]|nr:AAA family ATPase [Sandaracinaceae bacterium]